MDKNENVSKEQGYLIMVEDDLDTLNLLKTTTRTCQYCTEEIQVAAIICKHCGRDLPKEEPTEEMPAEKIVAKKKRPVWKEAAIIVGVWGTLFVIATLTGFYKPTSDVFISLPIGMLFWWAIFIGLIAVKRKIFG